MFDRNKILYFKRIILRDGVKIYKTFAWRKTKNHFHALTAEIMLQRTGAEQVSIVFQEFIRKYKTPNDVIKKCRVNIFANLGLTWRYKQYKNLCKELVKLKYIPIEKLELLKLPGVGDYIAGAYRSLHLNVRDYIIDSNVLRLYGRYYGFDTNNETRRKKWIIEFSESLTPKRNYKKYNYALLDYTRIICKPIPLCNICKLSKYCSLYRNKKKQK